MKRTCEDAVGALTRGVFAATESDALYAFIEHGVVGIREMTNLELVQKWDTYVADELDLIDPESNPNGEGDSLLFCARGARSRHTTSSPHFRHISDCHTPSQAFLRSCSPSLCDAFLIAVPTHSATSNESKPALSWEFLLMRRSVLVSLALASALSASVALAEGLVFAPRPLIQLAEGATVMPRPLRADGPVNPHRPTVQLAEGLVHAKRPLIQLADGDCSCKRPLRAEGLHHLKRPLVADGNTAFPRPLRADGPVNPHRPTMQLADNSPSLKRPLLADASGCTAVRRPLVA